MAGAVVFSSVLYVIKTTRQRSTSMSYINNLRQTLVENVVNVYTIIITIFLGVSIGLFILHHALTVEKNRTAAPTDPCPLLPTTIAVLLLVLAFITALPFVTRPALR